MLTNINSRQKNDNKLINFEKIKGF